MCWLLYTLHSVSIPEASPLIFGLSPSRVMISCRLGGGGIYGPPPVGGCLSSSRYPRAEMNVLTYLYLFFKKIFESRHEKKYNCLRGS